MFSVNAPTQGHLTNASLSKGKVTLVRSEVERCKTEFPTLKIRIACVHTHLLDNTVPHNLSGLQEAFTVLRCLWIGLSCFGSVGRMGWSAEVAQLHGSLSSLWRYGRARQCSSHGDGHVLWERMTPRFGRSRLVFDLILPTTSSHMAAGVMGKRNSLPLLWEKVESHTEQGVDSGEGRNGGR